MVPSGEHIGLGLLESPNPANMELNESCSRGLRCLFNAQSGFYSLKGNTLFKRNQLNAILLSQNYYHGSL